jgi:hypothetical protein
MLYKLSSGVVWGSVLGLLLFVCTSTVSVKYLASQYTCKLHADDMKLYTCSCLNADTSTLQTKLDDLHRWSAKRQLNISIQCAAMCVGGAKTGSAKPLMFYIDNKRIASVSSMRVLGVIIDSQLDFKLHINSITAQAYTRSNLIH